MSLRIRIVTFDFGNAEWYNVGYAFEASSITATVVTVTHFIAPNVSIRAVASGVSPNNQTL